MPTGRAGMPSGLVQKCGVFAATVLLLAGCSAENSGTEDGSGREVSTATASQTPTPAEADIVAQAKAQAASYDYDKALGTLGALSGSEATELKNQIEQDKTKLVTWPDNSKISHLFFHRLIVDPALAFDGDSEAKGLDDYQITTSEFTKTIQSLYDRGYILVSPYDIAKPDAEGNMQYVPLKLPEGKKPIVLSQDDLGFYESKNANGHADAIIVNQDGSVTEQYTDQQGNKTTGDYDVIPILDKFVKEHPDFSYRGFKGVLAVTGHEGTLGYKTSPTKWPDADIAAESAKAKKIADALKANGWIFASHTWNHIDVKTSTLEQVQDDTQRWEDEVAPIVGKVDQIYLPYGADLAGIEPYSGPKYEYLRGMGFRYFYTVDGTSEYWSQLEPGYYRQARINVDGIQLRGAVDGTRPGLYPFLDANQVIDRARPGL